MKKKRIISHVILFIVLAIPLFFANPDRHDQEWYIQIFEPVWRIFAAVLLGAIGGFILSGVIYFAGNIYSWYLAMIDQKMDKSVEFDKEWDFKKVFDLLINPCWFIATITIYVSFFFRW